MSRLAMPLALLMLCLLAACQRGGAATETPLPFDSPGVPPSPTLDTLVGFPTVDVGSTPGTLPSPFPTVAGFEGRFFDLRFATSGNGSAQSIFPVGTTDIYAIWDYDAIQPGAQIERVWYHNGTQYLDVLEPWDYERYGSTGAVRDVYHYNYEDNGVYPGQWRVELYLDGVLQVSGEFTVGP